VLDLSPDKILMLGIVALVVLGPNRLPGAARTMGRFIGQMRAMSASLQTEVREALHDPADPFASAIADFNPAAVRRTVRRAVSETLAPVTSTGPTVSPAFTNLPPAPGSSAIPVASTEVAGPPAMGWTGPVSPDDPALN
jgi:sec-independent protein translocase protein TatB